MKTKEEIDQLVKQLGDEYKAKIDAKKQAVKERWEKQEIEKRKYWEEYEKDHPADITERDKGEWERCPNKDMVVALTGWCRDVDVDVTTLYP